MVWGEGETGSSRHEDLRLAACGGWVVGGAGMGQGWGGGLGRGGRGAEQGARSGRALLRLRKPSRMVAMSGRFGVLSARRTDLRERRRCSRLRVALVLLAWCEAGEGVGGVRSGSVRWSDPGPEWGRGRGRAQAGSSSVSVSDPGFG